METYLTHLHNISLIVSYGQIKKKACPKHVPLELNFQPNPKCDN
jgi:hypothetical protein